MNGTIQKWGNSHAVRLPKSILSAALIQENDVVTFSAEEDKIVITKVRRRHKTLKERLTNASGEYSFEEGDTGAPCGGEVL